MITYEAALATILAEAKTLSSVPTKVESALHQVLAEDIVAPLDLPPFDNSAVDGYAVHTPVEDVLRLVGEAPAGRDQRLKLDPGETIRIFTGAFIPFGADAVVMQEDVARLDKWTIEVNERPRPGANIRRQGEELKRGDTVLPKGHVITPATIGVLATLGLTEVPVHSTPRLAIVATGNELVPPGQPLERGEVYASNGLALSVAARALGAEAKATHAVDKPEILRETLREAMEGSDVVLTAGGVSVGDHDYVREAWRELGFAERFWRIAIKPGKPVLFGRAPTGALVFGLPGNPVSALVTFHLFVRPALRAMQGLPPEPPYEVTLGMPVKGAPNRDEFVRVRLDNGIAVPLERQGSHMASGLALADALVRIPADASLPKGAQAPAIRLDWG
jgi:molybdopterin molybdotransferase